MTMVRHAVHIVLESVEKKTRPAVLAVLKVRRDKKLTRVGGSVLRLAKVFEDEGGLASGEVTLGRMIT